MSTGVCAAFAAGVVATMMVGCGGSAGDAGLEGRVAALRLEQQQREAELAALRQQEADAQRLLDQRRCEAQVAALVAQVALARADCVQKRSQFAACAAENSAHTAKSGIWGCAGGIGLAVITGGAAAPLGALGCGSGLLFGHVTTSNCGSDPVCTPDERVLLQQQLAVVGWRALPTCR